MARGSPKASLHDSSPYRTDKGSGRLCISQVKELDLDSLSKALQRNGTLPVGPSFDLLLQPLGLGNDNVGS